jgi:hypothetical protein
MLKALHTGRIVLIVVGLLAGLAPGKPPVLPPSPDISDNIATLKTLVPALARAEKDLKSIRSELDKDNLSDEAQAEINKRIKDQTDRVNQLRANFRIIATGVDESSYLSESETPAPLDMQFKDLLKPLMNEFQEATSKPREMEEMRSARHVWHERQELADAAIARIDPTLAAADSDDVKRELEGARKLWASRRDEAVSQYKTLDAQIQDRLKNTPSVLGVVSKMFGSFWKNRGLSVLMCLGIAIAIYFIASRLYFLLRRLSPIHRRKKNGFAARAADLIATGTAMLLAVFSIVVVLYMRGDWVLLALSIVVVVGVLWASKEALPPYIGQIKTILNLGPVRQGERILYGGVPWKVESLNMDCEFSNPELTGGMLRLPVAEVMKLNSRPADAKEPWFPSQTDDWVKLDDSCFGKVIQQTPEQVIVLQLGGSRKTYAVTEFLKRNPENLSRGYRVSVTFAITGGDIGDAIEEVPERFQEKIFAGLVAAFEREQVRSVKVEFANAGVISLSYAIIADLGGELASKARVVERMIQKLCLETCHEEKWEVALPQLAVNPPR